MRNADRAGRRDRWSAAGLAALAVAYLLANRAYPLDTLASPGPGVLPLGIGIALLGLAVWNLAAAGRGPKTRRPAENKPVVTAGSGSGDTPEATATTAEPGHPRAALLMAIALVAYAATLPRLGFFATSFALVLVAARLMGLAGWWRPAALALGVTLACRLIFVTWLRVPLP